MRTTGLAVSEPGDDDARLVERLRARDKAAFAALIDQHHQTLVRLALAYVHEEATAEEVAQEAWASVIKNLAGFEGRSSLKTWIFRIAVNAAKTRAAKEKRSTPFSALAPEEPGDEVDPARFNDSGMWSAPPAAWTADDPEKRLLRAEAMEVLARALDELPAAQRTVVTLRDVEGEDAPTVCNILGITESNQRVLLHRGRTRLRRALEEYASERSP